MFVDKMNPSYGIQKFIHSCSFRRYIPFVVLLFYARLISMQHINKQFHSTQTKAELQESYLQMFENYGTISNDNTALDIPDSSNISKACPKDAFFYNTNPRHMEAVKELQKIIMGQKSATDFIRLSSNFRSYGNIHSKVWLAAVIGATEFRPDTRHLKKPALVEVMPDRFVSYEVIQELKKKAHDSKLRQAQSCVRVDERFGSDNGRENMLWYFREDIMVNSHHWYWHMYYPAYSSPMRSDRRGELFYYMHQQVLARYDAERLSHAFPRVVPLPTQNRTILNEGYYAHLNDSDSRTPFTDRPSQTTMADIYLGSGPEDPSGNEESSMTIEKLNRFRTRIENSISSGYLNDTNGNRVSLQSFEGIDILVDVTESSRYSKNPSYYGVTGVHNMGHNIIAFVLDPKQPKIPPGVMADTGTSMRDIIFYRWHKFLDDLWDKHKQMLPPYSPSEGNFSLSYPVKILSVRVEATNGRPGVLNTFWSEKTFDLSRGLDLGSLNNTGRNPLRICLKHLNHEEFQYTISIEKRRGVVYGDESTVRIYMAPRFDDMGRRYSMDDQRRLFFALDIFQINLNSVNNTIVRSSLDSTLTIPFAQSYEEIQSGSSMPYCGCGWPHHLLIPRGSETGDVFDLFVMISDERDVATVANNNSSFRQSAGEEGCHQAPILCGLFREKYPFRYPMGYPFDRVPYSITVTIRPSVWWWEWKQIRRRVANIDEFIGDMPNMAVTQVTILHNNNSTL